MKKITMSELKTLVMETINEEKTKSRDQYLEQKVNSLLEKASPGNMNPEVMKNMQLSSVDVPKAQEIVKSGDGEPDVIDVSTGSWACDALMPTQSTMNMNKAIHFALGMLNGTMYGSGGPGGDLGAFVSVGGGAPYLLDGHHRWLATCMVEPSAQCQGFALNFPPEESVAVLNTMTGGLMGHNVGKSGSGDFKSFYDSEKLVAAMKNATSVPAASITPLEVMEKWTGESGDAAFEAAADKIIKNLEQCPGAKDSAVLLSQSREEMPVADDPEHATEVGGAPVSGDATQNVIDTLTQGKMDVNEASYVKRWNKLAGILKD